MLMEIGEEIKINRFVDEYHKATINLIFTNNWIVNQLGVRANAEGITLHQFNVLRILRGQYPEPCTNNQIKDRMLEKMSDVSRIADRLVAKGLVHKCKSDGDRRAVALTITEKGLIVLENLEEPMLLRDVLPQNLTEHDCQILNQLLNKMRGHCENDES